MQAVCVQLKVQSQNDTAKLAEAKQLVYLKVKGGGLCGMGSCATCACRGSWFNLNQGSEYAGIFGSSEPFASHTLPLQGFTDGVMTTGPHAGKKVSEAKPIIRDELLAAGQALPYSEPEKTVGLQGA
jgi:hypothetical protein